MTSTVDSTFPPAIGVEEGMLAVDEATVEKVDSPLEAIVELEVGDTTGRELETLTELVLETATELEADVLTELDADVDESNTELDAVTEPELDLMGLVLEITVEVAVETLKELDTLVGEDTTGLETATELDPNMVLNEGLVTGEVGTVVKNDIELETSDEVVATMLHIVTENFGVNECGYISMCRS